MKKTLRPAVYFIGGMFLSASIFTGYAFRAAEKTDDLIEHEKNMAVEEAMGEVSKDGKVKLKWYPPSLPEKMTFAGENVPLERTDIQEQFDRELMYNYYSPNSLLSILRLSTRYFPIIEKELRAAGVPEDFKYLCVAESALRNQTSSVGAEGFWQFMPRTAPQYGLEVNGEVDERYDITKSTRAAAQYLKEAYNKFGSWTLAAASYNVGMGGVNKFQGLQKQNSYYDLHLPQETMRYVFRILSFKYLMSEANKLGFVVPLKESYKPYNTKTVTVTTSIPDLADFAIEHGTTYKLLKLANPWLHDTKLTVKNKTYQIEVPQGQNI